jgi:hypothetical protein
LAQTGPGNNRAIAATTAEIADISAAVFMRGQLPLLEQRQNYFPGWLKCSYPPVGRQGALR